MIFGGKWAKYVYSKKTFDSIQNKTYPLNTKCQKLFFEMVFDKKAIKKCTVVPYKLLTDGIVDASLTIGNQRYMRVARVVVCTNCSI